jgi:hypothetical protein
MRTTAREYKETVEWTLPFVEPSHTSELVRFGLRASV